MLEINWSSLPEDVNGISQNYQGTEASYDYTIFLVPFDLFSCQFASSLNIDIRELAHALLVNLLFSSAPIRTFVLNEMMNLKSALRLIEAIFEEHLFDFFPIDKAWATLGFGIFI